MISVCMGCPKRAVGCKTECPEWAAEKADEKKDTAREVYPGRIRPLRKRQNPEEQEERTMRSNKYGNREPNYKGMKFDSQKELNRYCELEMLLKANKITNLRRKVPFQLIPTQRDDSGKVIEHCCRYYADFVYQKDGKTVVEDTKGYKTPEYIIKRKLMLYRYGIKITEV